MPQTSRLTLMSLLTAVLFVLGGGCAINRATAELVGDADLSRVKRIYVVKLERDRMNLDEMIAGQLIKMGYKATNGPESQVPVGVDAVAKYRDKWDQWIMIELTIAIRDPGNNKVLAVGNSLHTALTAKSPKHLVEEVLTNIFRHAKKGS
jgi:hypothetical protein